MIDVDTAISRIDIDTATVIHTGGETATTIGRTDTAVTRHPDADLDWTGTDTAISVGMAGVDTAMIHARYRYRYSYDTCSHSYSYR